MSCEGKREFSCCLLKNLKPPYFILILTVYIQLVNTTSGSDQI